MFETWDAIWDILKDEDWDIALTRDKLVNPDDPVTRMILNLYTIESFLYKAVNEASRTGDETKVDSLGPYSHCLDTIVASAQLNRTDLLKENFAELMLYRGAALTKD